MADKEKYFIPIDGELIEVEKNVYVAYYKMNRRERYLEERDKDNGVVSYNTIDSQGIDLCRRGCNNRTKNIKAQKVSETRCFLSFFTQKPQVKQSASVYPKWRLGRQTRFFHVLTQ